MKRQMDKYDKIIRDSQINILCALVFILGTQLIPYFVPEPYKYLMLFWLVFGACCIVQVIRSLFNLSKII